MYCLMYTIKMQLGTLENILISRRDLLLFDYPISSLGLYHVTSQQIIFRAIVLSVCTVSRFHPREFGAGPAEQSGETGQGSPGGNP